MADIQISKLPELGYGEVQDGDWLPVVDVSAGVTKKIKSGSFWVPVTDTVTAQANLAIAAKNDTLAIKTEIRNVYYGALSADPATRPDGTPSQEGDEYHNSTLHIRKVFSNGAWVSATPTDLTAPTGASLVGTSAIPGISATTVQGVLSEIVAEKAGVSELASAAGAAMVGLVAPSGMTATTLQGAVVELDTEKASLAALAAGGGAGLVGVTPVGSVAATNVQGAIAELDSEKVSLAALAGSGGSAMIGYTPAGTGAVATTVQNKLREFVSVLDFGADPTGAVDSTAAFNAAIVSLGGTHDLTTAYIYQPAKVLRIPSGVYNISSTLLIKKNNIVLQGDGMFNTTLKCPNTVQISALVRFQGAYACEINNLTIDGGLPFTPTGAETYGSDIGLVLDQAAHFRSVDLNICNTRYEGKRAIHLWEAYFENLRVFNVGFFGNGSNRSAGIRFTAVGKQDNTFPGGESNNVTYNKVAFGTVGSYVSADEVPTYNITFRDVIAEGRTWTTQYSSASETKWRVGSTAANFVIDGGYSFPHAQTYNANATLFDFTNVGPGCRVTSYRVYLELDSTYQEVGTILSCDSYALIDFDVDVEEVSSTSTVLINSSSISTVCGSWAYRTTGSRTRASLFNGTSESRFVGSLHVRTSGGINNYQCQPKTTVLGNVGAESTLRPVYPVFAWANYNASDNTLRGAGGLTVTKNSTGVYTFTFSSPMPDISYAVVVSANILNNTGEKPEIDNQTVNGFTIANRAGATYYDPSFVNVIVVR